MANVKFFSCAKKSTFEALQVKDALALYWIEETCELFKGDVLYGTGRTATASAAGLLSAEDKAKLDALVTASETAALTPIDRSIIIADNKIGVGISANTGNTLTKVADGLFVPAAVSVHYELEKQAAPSIGASATYRLKKVEGENVSYDPTIIDIPMDRVLKSAVVKAVAEDGVPYETAKVGDTYIEMTFNSDDIEPIYVPMTGEGAVIADVKIDESNANGLFMGDNGIGLNLATPTTAGAMSAVDKATLDAIPATYVTQVVFDVIAQKTQYEIFDKPDNTRVDYRDKEIRIMCPADTEWVLRQSGENSDANVYYIGFKAYAPNSTITGFKEDLAKTITDDTLYSFEGNDFAGIDALGRKYSVVWLPVAKHNDDGTWTYYGANSVEGKVIGWYYSVEWYNANGKIVASDTIKINLANEDIYNSPVPYYMNGYATVEALNAVEEKVTTVEDAMVWTEM